MTESKHTPGPWGFVPSEGHGRMRVFGPDMEEVAIVWSGIDDSNARLIATAPDQNAALLAAPRPEAALKGDRSAWLVEYADWFFKVRGAAIAKAIGNGTVG